MAVVSQIVTPEVLAARKPAGSLFRSALGLRRTQIGLVLTLLVLAIAIAAALFILYRYSLLGRRILAAGANARAAHRARERKNPRRAHSL